MKAVIVEDEFAAAQNIERLIKSVDSTIEIVAVLQNVDDSVEWFLTQPMPDVVFMDIHLADGNSFSIFKSVTITCPIIFTTAYDQYALKAFEVNSIDYLLKPISKQGLEKALLKLKNFQHNTNTSDIILKIMESINQSKPQKKSFLIPFKDKLLPVASDDIAYIYSKNKKAVLTCYDKREYTIDSSLEEFFKQLNPDQFFRANRQFIVAHKAITHLTMWFDGKLSVNLSVEIPEKIIVSRARSNEFKRWYSNESH